MVRWIAIGTIIRVKSRKEGFVVRCTAGLSSYVAPGLRVHFIPPQTDVPRQAVIAETSPIAGEEVALRFEEAFDADIAGKLVGMTMLASEGDLPEGAVPDDPDVVGFTVEDVRFGVLGHVAEVIEGPAQDLLMVAAEDAAAPSEILIPFVDALVPEIDARSRIVRTAIPEGLLHLEEA